MGKNNGSPEAQQKDLVITRVFNAPCEFMWKTWTDSKHLAQWWGPNGFTTPVCEIDAHPSGAIRIDMRGPDGIIYPMSGKYLEVIEPSLLVLTCAALDKNGKPLFEVFDTITFVKQNGKTTLIMHASVSNITPEAAPYLAGRETGWTQSLERLEAYATKQAMGTVSIKSSIFSRWSTYAPQIQSLLRIIAAIMFMLAGTVKLFAFPMGMPPNGSTAPLLSQIGIGGILEAFGGVLLLIGLFTRPIAFLLAGEMAVAYFQFHSPGGIWPVMNGGVSAVLYCFVWLYFSAAGAGPWSLDARRKK